jgi:3-hydroxyisobutyrate dehydrogenase-like beta-hydroxyacid dehydrogenase
MKNQRIGCIGLGNMGRGIALNLVKAGFEVTAYDIREEAREQLRQAGAKSAATPAGAAADAAVLTITVLNDAQVDEVLLGDAGALDSLDSGAVVVIHSTVKPRMCVRLATALSKRGVSFVDAPISGGAGAADDGTLTLMIGGGDDAVAACRPALEAVSARRFHVGGVGAGQTAKLVNNLMGIVNRIAVAEGLALARAVGLREEAVLDLIGVSSGNSWQVEHWRDMQAIARQSTTGAEGMALMAKKDLGLALELAGEFAVALPVTTLAFQNTGALFTDNG